MITWFYNKSSILKQTLETIESLRKQVFLALVPPRLELQFQWSAMIDRVCSSMQLSGSRIAKRELGTLLSSGEIRKSLPEISRQAIGVHRAYRYIFREWTLDSRPVTLKTVEELHRHMYPVSSQPLAKKFIQRTPLNSEAVLQRTLAELQLQKDHPVIQAGIAQIQLVLIAPFAGGNRRTARLLAFLFLAKYGYDCKRLLDIERGFLSDVLLFRTAIDSALSGNLTRWLEYFSSVVAQEMSIVAKTQQLLKVDGSDNFIRDATLNERQQEILELMDRPGTLCTNRKVQKHCGVSQITASRDLSKLANLGLISSIGKGRSVRYIKIY